MVQDVFCLYPKEENAGRIIDTIEDIVFTSHARDREEYHENCCDTAKSVKDFLPRLRGKIYICCHKD